MPAFDRAARSLTTPADLIEPLPPDLLDEPLEFIFADHFRQRSLCAALRRAATLGTIGRREADAMIAFLARDLPWHHADEEVDLFPALRRRAWPEDELGKVLARLTEDHSRAEPLQARIAAAFSAQAGADPVIVDTALAESMRAYAAAEVRHLAIENGIVLAIARIRLTRSDLKAMARNMRERRGLAA
jgi:hemerythrin-like domain-containing protein